MREKGTTCSLTTKARSASMTPLSRRGRVAVAEPIFRNVKEGSRHKRFKLERRRCEQ
jgi:hypothetical protein